MMAMPALRDFEGDVLIVYGDTPLLSAETLASMLRARRAASRAAVVLGWPAEPGAYGRLVVDGDGMLQAIVEAKDATQEQLRIDLCNSVMAVDAARLSICSIKSITTTPSESII